MKEKIYSIGIDARLWSETGVGRYIRNLVKELIDLDTTNLYVLFVRKKDAAAVRESVHAKNFKVEIADFSWHSFAEQLFFPWQLYKEGLNVVHFPYFAVPLLYRKKFVVTIHDLIINHFPTGMASTKSSMYYWIKVVAYKFVMLVSAWSAKEIITVSQSTKKEIIDHLYIPSKKITVTYEGVDEKLLTKNSSNKEKCFLYVGNAYPHKNLKRLIDAFALFAAGHKDTKLYLVGKEDYFYVQLQKEIITKHLEGIVVCKHNVSDEELGELYQSSLAVVVPSLMEGFGLPGLEAMQNNILVLASDIPSLKEIYADVALYIDPFVTQSIVEGLTNVYAMTTHTREEHLKKARQQVAKFSWKQMAAQTQKVYESCIGL